MAQRTPLSQPGGWNNCRTGVSYTQMMSGPGLRLDTWLRRRGCDQRTINQIAARRFAYGSYRPSDRAALLLDAAPILTPFADDAMAAD